MSSQFPIPTLPRTWGSVAPREHAANARMARFSEEAPRIPWDQFLQHFVWEQGEHVGVIGPTGQGKTTLMQTLLPLHPNVVVFATKPRDASMDRLIAEGYARLDHWQSIPVSRMPRRVLWPSARDLNSETVQSAVFRDALRKIYREGGWTVAIDELWIMVNKLRLADEIETYLFQARALGISLMAGTQRPVAVPLALYDQSTHLFLYRDNDEANLKRMSGIAYRSAELIRDLVSNLDQYQFLYVNTRTGVMLRTRAPKPRPIPKGGKK